MAIELWRWQYGLESEMWAAAVLSDGYPVVAGSKRLGLDDDFLAIKLDPHNGSVLWTWEEGTAGGDRILGAAAAEDGTVILAGYTEGHWAVNNKGGSDFAAVKLDSNGDIVWHWQEGTAGSESLTSVAVGEDGSIVMGGYSSDDFVMVKLDAHGNKLWNWTGDSGGSDYGNAVGIFKGDGSAVLAGSTSGDWDGQNAGSTDFAAVHVDADGKEVCRWQNGTEGVDILYAATLGAEDTIYMGGVVDGATDAGSYNPVTARLHANCAFSRKWQEGSAVKDDAVTATAMASDEFFVVGGYSEGGLAGTNKGEDDFFAAKIDPNSGRRLWVWQDGTEKRDRVQAMASTPDGAMVLTGSTAGSFAGNNTLSSLQGVAVMLQTSAIVTTLTPISLASTLNTDTWSPTSSPPLTWTSAPTSTLPSTPGIGIVQSYSASSSSSSMNPFVALVLSLIAEAVLAAVVYFWLQRVRGGAGLSWLKGRQGPTTVPTTGAEHGPDATSRYLEDDDGNEGRIMQPRKLEEEAGVAAQKDGDTPVDGMKSSAAADHPPAFTDASTFFLGTAAAQDEKIPEVISRGPGGNKIIHRLFGDKSGPEDGKEESDGGQNMVVTASDAAATLTGTRSSLGVALGDDHERPSHAPPNRGTDTGERPGGCGHGVVTEEDEPHKSETLPPVKTPRFGVARAVFDAAQELAQQSNVPGISEAASLVSLLVDLVTDHTGNPSAAEGKLRWCRSIVALLNRASGVLSKVDEPSIGAEHVLLDDVHESIDDLVQLIQTYKSRNALTKIMMSSLFKRRQDEAEAVIESAINRLQVGLQLQHGQKLDVVGKNVEAGLQLQQRESQKLAASSVAEALVESRRERRRRKLEQLEIPEDHLTITNELLGKGGFASVFMADYNGRNAGVKIVEFEHDLHGPAGDPSDEILSDRDSSIAGYLELKLRLGDGDGNLPNVPFFWTIYRIIGEPKSDAPLLFLSFLRWNCTDGSKRERREDRRRAFMRELEAMTRLRSPHTVHVYGAVTSRSDQLILVMELMSGGDLHRLLRDANHPLPEDEVRRIVGDVCAGMTFLHEKSTIHGDLKSANVLFDGSGRAKIGDFGTTRWAQHTSSTGLVTYTTRRNKTGQMSLPWAAPEVMDGNETSYKSDVYSFAIVIWEVLTRELPWASESSAQQIFVRVVFKGERPRIPGDASHDLVDAMRACWSSAPAERPEFASIMKSMKLHGWKER